ncbi:hypothetical protein F4814DRAFT_460120 [Daldinia grandis]|nr:hypothetical protein F4814DRAFT_460120 [Daldinia grandis]
MSVVTQTLRKRGWRVATTSFLAPQACQHRPISWISWEMPNPALYPPPHPPPSSESRQAARKFQEARNIGEASATPAAATTATGSQEPPTSGKVAPSSIQAGASRIPRSQTRAIQTQPESTPLLPTTLLRIPGVTATWPGKESKCPYTGFVYENKSPQHKEVA